jgi:hypothetical protein
MCSNLLLSSYTDFRGKAYKMHPTEIYIRNSLKKQKAKQDQEILDEMLRDLKKQHEQERAEKIRGLSKNLESLTR